MNILSMTPERFYSNSFLADSDVKAERIDFSCITSYRAWKDKLRDWIRIHESLHGLHQDAVYYMQDLINRSQAIYRIYGVADIYVYFWGNGEIKILPVWKPGIMIQSDQYWLDMYPFLNKQNNLFAEHHVYSITSAMFQILRPRQSSTTCLIASHNNHFGHFMLDNLPGLALCSRLDYRCISCCCTPIEYVGGILEILNSLVDNLSYSVIDVHLAPQSFCMQGQISCEVIPSSLFAHAYLWQQVGERNRKIIYSKRKRQSFANNPHKKIFLVRSGSYSSRISNRKEVESFLVANDFVSIDPTSMDIGNFIMALSAADIIICESGSTTLNAVLFGNHRAKVISLCPERLFRRPTESMIHGGLPYLFAFADRISFVLGRTVQANNIQSSDLCYYILKEIAETLYAVMIRND